jgi:hypothetical protein
MEAELSKKIPILKDKLEIREYVEEITKDGKIEWSSVNNGPFLVPWIMLSGWFGANRKTGTALYRMFIVPFLLVHRERALLLKQPYQFYVNIKDR